MPLPAGYTLDQPQGGPKLPAGYKLDTPPPAARPDTSGSMALDFMQGGGAELISTALGAYNLLRKIPGADKVLPPVSPEVQQYAEPPHTVAAKLGGIFTQLGEFAVPAGEAAAATKGAGLVARAGAQAAAAGGTQLVRTGGDIGSAADTAALGAAFPVAGAALGAAAPVAGRILRTAPGIAADVVGMVNPRAGNMLRVGIKAAKAAAAAGEEAAPAAAPVDPLLDQIAQGYGGKDFSSLGAADQTTVRELAARMTSGQAAAARTAPPAYTPRPPEYYGVKPPQTPPAAEVPPQPAPSAPAPAQPASAAAPAPPAPTAKVQPIRPATTGSKAPPEPVKPAAPPAEAEDIDFQQRYGEQEQPEVAKFLGHEQPEPPPQPKPASGAANAKSTRYADAIASWAKDMGMTPKAIADQWGTTTPEVRGQIILQLKQKGYLGANETIPRTSAQGIVDALKAKAATIKPPKGFSLGEMGTTR